MNIVTPSPTTDDTASRLAVGLTKISLVLRHHAWADGEQSGLTPTQAQILALLAGRQGGGMSISSIAAELAVTQPTISDAVAALVRKRLATKVRSRDDRRVTLIQLTARGRSQTRRSAQWPDALRDAINTLDAHERAVFVKAVVKMIHGLQVSGQIPMARMCTSCVYFRPHAHHGQARPHHCVFVDAPMGDEDLRIDCREHEPAALNDRLKLWELFVQGKPLVGSTPAAVVHNERSI